ncbi:type II secretion system protein [Pseudoalteromonas sp. J010]|uniref:type IV pilin protein n=1 Tax=Pseudoalteromonas sp. J010 TaxID=998465 RepID=UPI000F6560EF|nr:type II secretion system protein [Pseudoalteromonas sp. J010]RRS10085.1 type II secretion system protein [Pseudoalteromonas sp. J010]
MKKLGGFTMIELLIVLTIMGLIMSLVAPLSIKAINRSDAKMELVEVKNWLRNRSNKAFLQQRDYLVVLDKHSGTVYQGDTEVESKQLKYLQFPKQEITLNRFGMISVDNITTQYLDQTLQIELQGNDAP